MNNKGSIARFETEADATEAGYTTPLSKREARKLLGMQRDARHAELARMRDTQRLLAQPPPKQRR